MKIPIFSIIQIIIFVAVCSCNRNAKRNTISFKDNDLVVQDSLEKIISLLPKLPKRAERFNINYAIIANELYVNNKLFIQKADVDGTSVDEFTNSEKKEFISLAFFLNDNYISSAYYDQSTNFWRFIYRQLQDKTYNNARDIIVSNEPNYPSSLRDSVLDHKGKIYLVSLEGASIR